MKKKDVPLNKPEPTDVAVRAGIEGSGISIKAKSRAVSALDRMVGAALDIPGTWFERRAERARLIAVTEQEAMKIDAQSFLENRKDKAIGAAHSNWIRDARRVIDNRSEIASYAIEEMKLLESPNEASVDDPVDYCLDDWLNAFAHRADMASSDQMRSILGRILAGEIVRPKSFSVATLRIVSELDQRAALNFQELVLNRVSERFIPKSSEDEKGPRMIDLYDLEERGLLKETSGSLRTDLTKNSEGYYYYREQNKILKMIIEPVNEYFPVSTVVHWMVLTQSGQQLATLLPYNDEAGLRAIAAQLGKHDAVKYMEIVEINAENLSSIELILDRRK